jgi:hypothetical protein
MIVTSIFLLTYARRKIVASTRALLQKTNLSKLILSDGTIMFAETARSKKSRISRQLLVSSNFGVFPFAEFNSQ